MRQNMLTKKKTYVQVIKKISHVAEGKKKKNS